jgi:hypothetical protein
MLEFPCFHTGACNIAVPYRLAWNENRKHIANPGVQGKFNILLIPQPYPDDLLPASAATPGFERQEIFWGTKDNFHPNFTKPEAHRGDKEQVFVQGGLDTLRALLRLQQKVDFGMHFLLKHHLDQADPRLGVPQLLDQFKYKKFYNTVPWQPLVGILANCKLNVPVGGLWGSIPETIFTKGMPLIFPRNQFSGDFGSILPLPEHADEQDISQAIEELWFNERIYRMNYEVLQDLFKDHRTNGLRENLKLALERIGL